MEDKIAIPESQIKQMIIDLRRARAEMIPFNNDQKTMLLNLVDVYRNAIDGILVKLEKYHNFD